MGPTNYPEAPRRWAVLRFLAHFHNVLIYVLIGAAVATARCAIAAAWR